MHKKEIWKLKKSVGHGSSRRGSIEESLLPTVAAEGSPAGNGERSARRGPDVAPPALVVPRSSLADQENTIPEDSAREIPASTPLEEASAEGRSSQALWQTAMMRAKAVQAFTSSAAGASPRSGTVQPKPPPLSNKWLFLLGSVHSHLESTGHVGVEGINAPAGVDGDETAITLEQLRSSSMKPARVPSLRKDVKYLARMIWSSYLNVLLLAVPLGIIAGAFKLPPILVFSANFLALIPLALILGEITEDLALRFGDSIGGLLNATFGNVVEMIIGLAALSQGLYKVVAASLIGSILSNLLLVLGCCFFFGGFKHKSQEFNAVANKVSSSLLFLAAIAIIIPTTAKMVYGEAVITPSTLRSLSHAISIMLILMYFCYLFFQLKTHADMTHPHSHPVQSSAENSQQDVILVAEAGQEWTDADVDLEARDPYLTVWGAFGSLTLVTITVAVCSEYLTGAIEAVSKVSGVNPTFLGLIVLPIAGNAAEHITAVYVAIKDKMDLAISVALGSSIQIAIFVLPVTVLVGWTMGKELTLDLDPFAVLMVTVSVILAYFVSSDGSSNWILGLQLIMTYVLIGAVYLLEKESNEQAPGSSSTAKL